MLRVEQAFRETEKVHLTQPEELGSLSYAVNQCGSLKLTEAQQLAEAKILFLQVNTADYKLEHVAYISFSSRQRMNER